MTLHIIRELNYTVNACTVVLNCKRTSTVPCVQHIEYYTRVSVAGVVTRRCFMQPRPPLARACR